MKLVMLLIISFYMASCQMIEYSDDLGFMNSAEAGIENLPVFINDKPCIDMDGIIGRCSKAITDNKDLEIRLFARPYSYRYSLALTNGVGCVNIIVDKNEKEFCPPNIKIDVPEGKGVTIKIPSSSYLPLFMIVGRIAPDDRPEPISAMFRALITVYDSNFSVREGIYQYKNYTVVGEHAKYTDVVLNGKHKTYEEKTAVKSDYDIVMSESYNMRFNFEFK